MKKIILLFIAAVLLCATPAPAQSWLDALKKAGTAAADKATDGKLTQYALVGTWTYSKPGVKFEGNDLMSELGGSMLAGTIADYLAQAYLKAGLKPGTGTLTFTKENKFSAALDTHKVSGSYEFDPAAHLISLNFTKDKKFDLGSIPGGHVYIDGSELLLVFPVTKLIEKAKALGSNVSSLESVMQLLEQYKNVYIGFTLTKQTDTKAK